MLDFNGQFVRVRRIADGHVHVVTEKPGANSGERLQVGFVGQLIIGGGLLGVSEGADPARNIHPLVDRVLPEAAGPPLMVNQAKKGLTSPPPQRETKPGFLVDLARPTQDLDRCAPISFLLRSQISRPGRDEAARDTWCRLQSRITGR
jgi:hypothetical protein